MLPIDLKFCIECNWEEKVETKCANFARFLSGMFWTGDHAMFDLQGEADVAFWVRWSDGLSDESPQLGQMNLKQQHDIGLEKT